MISQMFTLISFSVLQISRHDIFFFLSIGFPCCIECECLVRVCVCLCIQMNMPVKLRVFVVCFHKDFSIVLYKANKKKKKKKRSGSGIRLFTIRKCLMHTRCDLHCFWILEWILLIFFLFKSLFSKYKYFHHCCYFIWICCFFFLPFFFHLYYFAFWVWFFGLAMIVLLFTENRCLYRFCKRWMAEGHAVYMIKRCRKINLYLPSERAAIKNDIDWKIKRRATGKTK